MKPFEPTSGRHTSATGTDRTDKDFKFGPDQTRGGSQNQNPNGRPADANQKPGVKNPAQQTPNKPAAGKNQSNGGKF